MDHTRKTLGEVSKQFVEIAVCGDRFRNFQQGSVLLRQSLAGGCRSLSIDAQYGPSARNGSRGPLLPMRTRFQMDGKGLATF